MPQNTESGASHIDLIEAYFDETSQDWSDLYRSAKRTNDLVLADRKNAAVAHLQKHLPPNSHVLDMGCGAGHTAIDLIALGHTVHGVDISTKMLEHARKNFEECGFTPDQYQLSVDDLFKAELPAEGYDGIAALGFLQYQEDEAGALAALHRVLKPGGIMVITGPSKTKIANWFGMARYYYALRRRIARLLKPKPKVVPAPADAPKADSAEVLHTISAHSYSYGRFRRLLLGAGFEVVALKGHGYVNFEIIGRRLGPKGELRLHRFFTSVAKVLPIGRWANDLIFVARKP